MLNFCFIFYYKVGKVAPYKPFYLYYIIIVTNCKNIYGKNYICIFIYTFIKKLVKDLPEILKSLSKEELAKIKPLTEEEIEEVLEKGRKDYLECIKHYPLVRSDGPYYKNF